MCTFRQAKKMYMQLEMWLPIHTGIMERQQGYNITMKPFIKDQLQLSICMVKNSLLITFLSSGLDSSTTLSYSQGSLKVGMISILWETYNK